MYVPDRMLHSAQDLAGELGDATDPRTLVTRALARLLDLFHADLSGVNLVSRATGQAHSLTEPEPLPRGVADALRAHVADHPLVQHYSNPANGMTPVRLSDLVPDNEWRHRGVYADVFRPMGTDRQLVMMVRAGSETGILGYAVNRGGRDFSDDEVGLAAVVQPVLVALFASLRVSPVPAQPGSAPAYPHRLTARERGVLDLLARGLTARAIGRRLSITDATVRKHLENAYRKLGCSDRLTAVTRARALGLIDWESGPTLVTYGREEQG